MTTNDSSIVTQVRGICKGGQTNSADAVPAEMRRALAWGIEADLPAAIPLESCSQTCRKLLQFMRTSTGTDHDPLQLLHGMRGFDQFARCVTELSDEFQKHGGRTHGD